MFHAIYIAKSKGYYPPEVTYGTSDRSDVFCFGVVSATTYVTVSEKTRHIHQSMKF